jgi:hypothetical protein
MCPPGFVGTLPHVSDCSMFIFCDGRNRTIQRCPCLNHFDITRMRCVFMSHAVCWRPNQTSK